MEIACVLTACVHDWTQAMAAELIFSSWINIKWISLDYTFIYFLFCLHSLNSRLVHPLFMLDCYTFFCFIFCILHNTFHPFLSLLFPQLDLSLFLYSEMLIVSNRALHIKRSKDDDWINTG